MKSFLCVSDVTPDFIVGTLIRLKDNGDIQAIELKEFPYSKFPRNISILPGSCLELDYHGMMFSVRSSANKKFHNVSCEVQVTLSINSEMIGDSEEDAKAKLGEYLKANAGIILRPSNNLDITVVSTK